MIELKTRRGLPVTVPENETEDPSPKFTFENLQSFKNYYDENGYAIIRNLLSPDTCSAIRKLWEEEVKPFNGPMYRQTNQRAERHDKNDKGWVMNPILNLQSVDPAHFPKFRDYATTRILADRTLGKVFSLLLSDKPKIVQSMYFEGNSATWEHQDSYYLDSETTGEMSAAWIALEDISARAGRFFVCPRSNKLKLDDHSLDNNIAENHDRYIASVVEKIRAENMPILAPTMKQGDVLFWNSWTIHGSLDSQDTDSSRSSITCHAIPDKKKFLQLQTRSMELVTAPINDVNIYRPKDLAKARNRFVFFVEAHFPKAFYWLKNRAIVYVMKKKSH